MTHGFMGKCYRWCHQKSVGQLLLRLALGTYFIGHGAAKFQNISATVAMFGQWGFSPFWAYAASGAELVSGIAIALGAFLWIAAALVVIVMAVAVYSIVGPNPEGQPWLLHFIFGWGPNVVYATAALSLAFTGAGKWSVTGWLMRRYYQTGCKECKIDHGMKCECATDTAGAHSGDCSCKTCGCDNPASR